MLPWNPPANLGGGQQQQQSSSQQAQPQQPPQRPGLIQQPQAGWSNGPPASVQQQQQQQLQQQQQVDNNAQAQQQVQQQPPINLSSVLHYLQTEWRRYERERNEWEIERGEMRARIALLEGERRGNENLKTDLMRRVKMLEYALRQERNKYLTSAQQHAAAQAAAAAQKEKEKDKPEGDANATKPASAIPEGKKKALAGQGGAAAGSRAASPAPPSEDGQSNTGSAGVPEVVVSSSSSQPPASASASAIPSHVQQAAASSTSQANLHRAGSTASLASLPNGASTMNLPGGSSTLNLGVGSSTLGGAGGFNPGVGRDPRARAKSREYLRQCLQEITYLTSAAALNPLPERTPGGVPRPRKEMREIQREKEAQTEEGKVVPVDPTAAAGAEKPTNAEALNTTSSAEGTAAALTQEQPQTSGGNPSLNGPLARKAEATTAVTSENGTSSSSSTSSAPKSVPDLFSSMSGADAAAAAGGDAGPGGPVTAIFKPESSEEWQKALKKAGQSMQPRSGAEAEDAGVAAAGSTVSLKELQEKKAEEGPAATAAKTNGSQRGRSDTAVLAGPGTGTSAQSKEAQEANEHKNWRPRRTLRAHLDATRCLAFDRSERPSDVTLVTGGDDCTVKVWRLPPQSVAAQSRGQNMPDSEPTQTYRGHGSPITSLCVSGSTQRVYSSSLDSTVQVWQLPPKDREPYSAFDASLNVCRLEGHTDGVWDVCLLGGASPDREVIASASADGTVKVWDVSPTGSSEQAGGELKLSWTAHGTDGGEEAEGGKAKILPTSLALCASDMTKLAVAYQDSLVRIFDTETGKLVLTLQSNEGYDGTPATQINRIVSHPTLPMLMTAHENKYIRLYDLKSGACTHSILAHSDAVTSLDVDPSGLTIASASHDSSVKFWDLLQTRSCIQQISATHTQKGDEGVLDLKYHPTLPFVASAGADGQVRIYG